MLHIAVDTFEAESRRPTTVASFSPPKSLTSRRDFLTVQSRGQRVRQPLLTVLFLTSSEGRVGYTVSRKVGGAVVRNRVRRRMREIVRLHASMLVPACDYVLIGAPRAAEASYVELEQQLLAALGEVRRRLGRGASC